MQEGKIMFKVINLKNGKLEKSFKLYRDAVLYANNQHNKIYKTSGLKVRFKIIQ